MMIEKQVRIRGICEQDIDLLLLEELVVSASFRTWFLKHLGISAHAELLNAERSVSTVSGESDLELTLLCDGKTIKVLIENKIDAPLQPAQAARYRERAVTYQTAGKCSHVTTAVVAPAVYFNSQTDHGFDVFVKYESVLSWFESATDLGARGVYKAVAMRQAIERGKRGWQMVPDSTVTQFWQSYWELAQERAPLLRMPKPSTKPATSHFITFEPLSLPDDVSLIHKVGNARVDLQFSGMGNNLTVIETRFGRHLSPAMRVEQAQKSAVIRITVEEIDMNASFAESSQKVEKSLAAALSLLRVHDAVVAESRMTE